MPICGHSPPPVVRLYTAYLSTHVSYVCLTLTHRVRPCARNARVFIPYSVRQGCINSSQLSSLRVWRPLCHLIVHNVRARQVLVAYLSRWCWALTSHACSCWHALPTPWNRAVLQWRATILLRRGRRRQDDPANKGASLFSPGRGRLDTRRRRHLPPAAFSLRPHLEVLPRRPLHETVYAT